MSHAVAPALSDAVRRSRHMSRWLNPIVAVFAVLLMLLAGFGAIAQTLPPVAAFQAPATIEAVEAAPGGRHFFIRSHDGTPQLRIFRINGQGVATPIHTLRPQDARRLNWAGWAAPDRLILSLEGPRNAGVQADEPDPPPSSRLIAMDPDGRRRLPLVQPDELTGFLVRDQDNLVDLLANDPDHILVAYSAMTPAQPPVMRVNIRTGEVRLEQVGRVGISSWMADSQQRVRIGRGRTRSGVPRLELRDAETGRWRSLAHMLYEDARFDPVGFAQRPDDLVVISDHAGEPAGVYLFNTARDVFMDTLYRHPRLPVLAAQMSADGRTLLRVALSDRGRKRWVTPRTANGAPPPWAGLFPRRAVEQTAISLDERFITLLVSGPSDPAAYYLFDRVTRAARYVGPKWARLQGHRLATPFEIDIPASDGAALSAQILTASWRGALDRSRPLPFVILPHGGPGPHDREGFDRLAQFIASRGIGVLRLGGRGADGVPPPADGRRPGALMAEDVLSAANWMVENGYVDAWRIAAAGEGFGAYAALKAAQAAPDRFACVASINGVTDLRTLAAAGRRSQADLQNARHVETLWPNPRERASQSAAPFLADLDVPVFLAHTLDGGLSPIAVDQALALSMTRSLAARARAAENAAMARPGGSYTPETFFPAFDAFLTECLDPQPLVDEAARDAGPAFPAPARAQSAVAAAVADTNPSPAGVEDASEDDPAEEPDADATETPPSPAPSPRPDASPVEG